MVVGGRSPPRRTRSRPTHRHARSCPIAAVSAASVGVYGVVLERGVGIAWSSALAAMLLGMVSYPVAARVRIPSLVVVAACIMPFLPGLSIYRGLALLGHRRQRGAAGDGAGDRPSRSRSARVRSSASTSRNRSGARPTVSKPSSQARAWSARTPCSGCVVCAAEGPRDATRSDPLSLGQVSGSLITTRRNPRRPEPRAIWRARPHPRPGMPGPAPRPDVQHGPRIAEAAQICAAMRGSVRRVTVYVAPMLSYNCALDIRSRQRRRARSPRG